MSKQVSATAKISRNRRKGIELGGSEFDPRKPKASIHRMNTAQLNAHINRLDNFNSRNRQFVQGAEGLPIQRATWEKLKNVESRINNLADKTVNRIADLKPPNTGLSIGEREANTMANNIMAAGKANTRHYFKMYREHRNIAGERAAKMLLKQGYKRLKSGFENERINEDRERVDKMIETMGMEDLREEVSKLSDNQLNILWNYTNFGGGLGSHYWMIENKGSKDKRFADVNFEGQREELYDFVRWAATLPKTKRHKANPGG